MITIITTQANRKNNKVIIKGIKISFDSEGKSQLNEEDAKIVLEDPTIKKFGGIKESKIENSNSKKATDESKKNEEIETESFKALKEQYSTLSNVELKKDIKEEELAILVDNLLKAKKEEISKSFGKKSVDELKAIAEEANLPKEEYENLEKLELIKYLVNKI